MFINNMYFGTSLTLHHPSSRFVNFIEFTFKVAYRISEVEFSIDIISSDQLSLLRLLQITSYIKNPGKAVSLAYNETTYLNDNRKSSTKGAKIYHKKDEFGEPVRLEMRMKRRYFQKRNINKMSTALSLSAEMIFSDWTFKMFELKKFMKKTLVNHEDKEVMIILNQFQGRLFEVGFFSAFNSNEDGGGVRIVRKYVKDFNVDPDSCFTSLPFEKDFFKVISGNKFII
ncbi:hypothetical protein G3N56_02485 [Desulfovibrio sulfodismutans]|uniref:Uncharacterized protein n=1 Tax=Desulfolutivibrio sulfodismutans TaxID=63561 RepID=A0A7K3NHE2_9BACT|nr:hypothetical protein [Desulfolutivibrio sulfodismutans]NDY55610.1 hypothetical protein [Desulfolutivibrio sulfodismutans]QLA11688.1 hypothetical protein GD606_05075 [Desulfolutivibrio sulfodismutans DSM 3696]